MNPLMGQMLEETVTVRQERVAAWLAQSHNADIAIATCTAWIRDVSARGFILERELDWASLPDDLHLGSRLSVAGLDSLSSALTWQLEDRQGPKPTDVDLLGHALAVAAGRLYALREAGVDLAIGGFVASIDNSLWEDFADATAEILRNNVDALTAISKSVEKTVEQAHAFPDKVCKSCRFETPIALLVKDYANKGSPDDAWSDRIWSGFFYHVEIFEILRRADPQRFIESVDKLPHPALAEQCFNGFKLLADLQNTRALLQHTGLAFDSDGVWLRAGTSAIPILKIASRQLLAPDKWVTCESDLKEEKDRFDEAVGAILDVLFARSDAEDLGWSWLENLLGREPQPPKVQSEDSGCLMLNRLGILITALSRRLEPKTDRTAWIADAKPANRLYRVVAVLSVAVLSNDSPSADVGAVVKDLLKVENFKAITAIKFIETSGAPLRNFPGLALTKIPDAPAWFAETWSSLRFEREKAWRQDSTVRSNFAEVMGLWGLGMIEALLKTPKTDPEEFTLMWYAVEKVFREAELLEPWGGGQDFWPRALTRLFGLWASARDERSAAGQNMSPFSTSHLGNALAPYVQIDEGFITVILGLYHARVSAGDLDEAMRHAGYDLVRIIDRFSEDTNALRNRRVWPESRANLLKELKHKIKYK